MIHGTHALIYAQDADAARAFFRDTLGLASVDAGDGWLIFALPPAELGIHPAEEGSQPSGRHVRVTSDSGACASASRVGYLSSHS